MDRFRSTIMASALLAATSAHGMESSKMPRALEIELEDHTVQETRYLVKPLMEKEASRAKRELDLTERLNEPIVWGNRRMVFPMSERGRDIIEAQSRNEDLVEIGRDPVKGRVYETRESVAKAYRLAQKYAAEEGYVLEVYSAHRTAAKQRELYNGASRRAKGRLVAPVNGSNHRRGSALDVVLLKEVDGKLKVVTPTRQPKSQQVFGHREQLMKYMNMAGFVNYTVEPWHFEIGSQHWANLMKDFDMIDSMRSTRSRIYSLR